MSMIDEKIILSEISNLKKNVKSENGDYLSGYFSALSTIEGFIAGQDKNGGWIPCSERFPTIFKDVLIFTEEKELHVAKIDEKEWILWDGTVIKTENVVAWMPLPEPYKPR